MLRTLSVVAISCFVVLACNSKQTQASAPPQAETKRHSPTPPAKTPVKAAAKKSAPEMPPLKKTAGRGSLVSYSPEHIVEFTKDLGVGTLLAVIETNHGTLNCELFEKRAPKTVANFVGLARGLREYIDVKTNQPTRGKYFDGTRCHRVIPNFMMQCGDPTGTGTGGPGFRFVDEFHPELRHTTGGILSMANAGPSTNGSQFFITERATPHLDNRHAVFGRCAEVDLIQKITRLPKDPNDGSGSRPAEPVVLKSVKIVRRM